MSHTRSWEETSPAGTEDASLGDNRIRNLKTDLGERLEDMLYGFNVSDGTGHEGLYGIKKLRFRELAADPTIIDTGNEAYLYTKNVSNISELFFKDNANNGRQLTSGGNLKVLDADGAVVKTGDQTISGVKTLASPVINTGISGTAILDEDDMTSDSATKVSTQQSIKKYVDDQIAAAVPDDDAFGAWSARIADAEAGNPQDAAATDGFVIAYSGINAVIKFYTPVATVRREHHAADASNNASILMPVRKGDTWKVTGATIVYWLPIGA